MNMHDTKWYTSSGSIQIDRLQSMQSGVEIPLIAGMYPFHVFPAPFELKPLDLHFFSGLIGPTQSLAITNADHHCDICICSFGSPHGFCCFLAFLCSPFPQDALKTPKMKSFMNSLDISTQDVPKLHQRSGDMLFEVQIPSMSHKNAVYMRGFF